MRTTLSLTSLLLLLAACAGNGGNTEMYGEIKGGIEHRKSF